MALLISVSEFWEDEKIWRQWVQAELPSLWIFLETFAQSVELPGEVWDPGFVVGVQPNQEIFDVD